MSPGIQISRIHSYWQNCSVFLITLITDVGVFVTNLNVHEFARKARNIRKYGKHSKQSGLIIFNETKEISIQISLSNYFDKHPWSTHNQYFNINVPSPRIDPQSLVTHPTTHPDLHSNPLTKSITTFYFLDQNESLVIYFLTTTYFLLKSD